MTSLQDVRSAFNRSRGSGGQSDAGKAMADMYEAFQKLLDFLEEKEKEPLITVNKEPVRRG